VNFLQPILDLIPSIIGNVTNKLQLFALALIVGSGTFIVVKLFNPETTKIDRELRTDQTKNESQIENLRTSLNADAIAIFKKEDTRLIPIYVTPNFAVKDQIVFFNAKFFEQISLGNCTQKYQMVFNDLSNKKLDAIVCPVGRKGVIAAGFEKIPLKQAGIDGDLYDPVSGYLWNFGEYLLEKN
jgi:hypothetical protein